MRRRRGQHAAGLHKRCSALAGLPGAERERRSRRQFSIGRFLRIEPGQRVRRAFAQHSRRGFRQRWRLERGQFGAMDLGDSGTSVRHDVHRHGDQHRLREDIYARDVHDAMKGPVALNCLNVPFRYHAHYHGDVGPCVCAALEVSVHLTSRIWNCQVGRAGNFTP